VCDGVGPGYFQNALHQVVVDKQDLRLFVPLKGTFNISQGLLSREAGVFSSLSFQLVQRGLKIGILLPRRGLRGDASEILLDCFEPPRGAEHGFFRFHAIALSRQDPRRAYIIPSFFIRL
jgi:hypothetical protein